MRLQSTTQAAKKISSASSAFLEITTTSHRAAKSKEDGASGADETEICGEVCIPMGENLSLFLCKVSESYVDDDDADGDDEDNRVPIPWVTDLSLFPASA